jgi:hypothetical protein
MVATPGYNPYLTTETNGTFNAQSKGLVQGDVYPDPAIQYKRAGGVLASTETLCMYGGCGIYIDIPGNPILPSNSAPNPVLGATVGRATALTGSKALLGFSVSQGAYAAITSPQSPVGLVGSYGQVMYYRLGSGARIIVACSPNLVNLYGEPINTQVSWDYTNQQLEPYTSTTVSSGTYNSTTGAVSITTAAAHGLNPGDTFELSSLTGTGGYASLDGEWTATSGTTGTTLNFTGPTGLGSTTLTGGTVGSGGALDVDVLEVQATNCMTVNYNSGSNTAAWNFNGSCAVILI